MLYFIRCNARKAMKIGYSADPSERLGNLQTANPDRLTLLGICPGDTGDEKVLHARFAHLHLRGEWFREDAELLAFAKEACAGHRLRGRCPKCGESNVPLHEELLDSTMICDGCDPPGLPRTLRQAREPTEPIQRLPAGGGYRLLRKGFK